MLRSSLYKHTILYELMQHITRIQEYTFWVHSVRLVHVMCKNSHTRCSCILEYRDQVVVTFIDHKSKNLFNITFPQNTLIDLST